MRDEIRKQERADAEQRARRRAEEDVRRAREDYQEQLRRRDEEYDTKTRQLEDQLNRVRANWKKPSVRAGQDPGSKKASPARTCSARNSSGASPPTGSPSPRQSPRSSGSATSIVG